MASIQTCARCQQTFFIVNKTWNLAKKCAISFIEKLVRSRNLHVLFSRQIYQIYWCSDRFKSSRCTLHTLELYCCHSRRSADFIATVWTAFFGWFVAIPVILAFIIIRRAEFGWRSKRRTNSWPRYSCKVFWRQHFKRRRSEKIDLLRYIEEVLECTYDKGTMKSHWLRWNIWVNDSQQSNSPTNSKSAL